MNKPPALPQLGLSVIASALLTVGRNGKRVLPDKTWRYSSDSIDLRHLRSYISAFDFAQQDQVPLPYLYLLAQRAQLAVMLGADFPFSVVGMVHTANEMLLLRSVELALPFEISVSIKPEPLSQTGSQFIAFECVIFQNEEPVASCVSRYLAKRGRSKSESMAKQATTQELQSRHIALENYFLAADSGRQYAKLSGDYNPIHLWTWSARLLGFKRPIIHGMHTVAKVASALERQHTDSSQCLARLEARFLKPIALPAQACIQTDGNSFEVNCLNAKAIEGQFAFSRLETNTSLNLDLNS
jgi:hypothetical protein